MEKKDRANASDQSVTKSVMIESLQSIVPNKQMSDVHNSSQYCHLDSSSNSSVSCMPKLSVHYIVSLNNEPLMASCKSSTESSTKIDSIDCERKCLISLPIDGGSHTDCEPLKAHHSVANQRLLISPTDFLTLSEEGVTHKSSAVRKDVNLSTSSVELIRRNNSDTNFAICLDRYCESPLLLEAHKDSQLICEDDTSCNGRNSRLSENQEDITADELFATTFGGDQSNSLREVVTPIEVDSARNTPTLMNKDSMSNTKAKSNLETLLCEDMKPRVEMMETKPVLTVLDPLETETNNDCTSSQSQNQSSFSLISSHADTTTSPSQSLALTTLDIKVLPTGLLAKDSILLANLAAALPSSLTSRQIAVQVIREDGTSLVLPINPKHDSSGSAGVTSKQINSDLAVSTSVVLAEMVSPNASIRPFKCELCNSTFTRLGNYTRHKKIHSFPSKVGIIHRVYHCVIHRYRACSGQLDAFRSALCIVIDRS